MSDECCDCEFHDEEILDRFGTSAEAYLAALREQEYDEWEKRNA